MIWDGQLGPSVAKFYISYIEGAIKSQNMFMSSYVTLISHFYDAYSLIQSNIIFSEFKFSFYSPGQPPLENHISGKENWHENLLPELNIALKNDFRN